MDRWKYSKTKRLTLVIKNSSTYCKKIVALEANMTRMPLGGRLVGVNHRAPPILTYMSATLRRNPYFEFFS